MTHPRSTQLAIATITFLITLLIGTTSAFAAPEISFAADENTLTVEDAPEMQVIAVSKTVVIKRHAKEVLVWGGDVIVEGRVDGDVATIGGDVIQKEGAYIGGDVIVFGGQYRSDGLSPLRADGRETIVFGAFEEELRMAAQDPFQILSPKLTAAFFAQRLLTALFWFIITFGVATIAPGAVGRAVARFRLSGLRIAGIGAGAFLLTCASAIAALSFLPEAIAAIVGVMTFVLLFLAYGFGRVTLQVSFGKLIQRCWSPKGTGSEALTILVGVLAWTFLLSLPYVWPLGVFILFSIGVGLVITSRSDAGWKTG